MNNAALNEIMGAITQAEALSLLTERTGRAEPQAYGALARQMLMLIHSQCLLLSPIISA